MNKKSKILIVDDNKINLLIAEKLLRDYDYIIETATSGEEALSKATANRFDLVIMDIMMPGMDGFEACVKIKDQDPFVLVIMLTGLTDDTALHKSFAAGAVDFIKKPIHKMELYVRVKNALKIRNVERSLKKALAKLEDKNRLLEILADTDGLTGLYNHRYLINILAYNINMTKRYTSPLSIIMFDIDNFKHINDTYGHVTGDKILKSVAGTFRDNLRNVDIVGRYGGEEFLIILQNTNLKGCIRVAELLRKEIGEKIVIEQGSKISVTISGGACEYKNDYNLPNYISTADKLLYKAKKNGRNRIEY